MSTWKDTRPENERQAYPAIGSVVITHTEYTIDQCAGVRHVLYCDGHAIRKGFMPFYNTGGSGKNGEVGQASEVNFRWACHQAQKYYDEAKAETEAFLARQAELHQQFEEGGS